MVPITDEGMGYIMLFSAKEMVKKRKSVRTYDGNPLSISDKEKLEQFLKSVPNPFDTPVEFRLLDAKEHGLTSPVIIGAGHYFAAKVPRCDDYEVGYGYSFECACLYAESLGLGTVMLAASINRPTFEKVMDLQENEVMPVASPVGYPAAKRSIRESIMRKSLKADSRIPFGKMFFDGDFSTGLEEENAGVFSDALEMARWSPSAANKQPCRAVVTGDTVHFYECKTFPENPRGDVQKLDIGIALAHFDLTMQEDGHSGRFTVDDPGIVTPKNVGYIISYNLER